MNTSRRYCLLGLSSFCLVLSAARADSQLLVFDVTEETSSAALDSSSTPRTELRHYTETVFLGTDVLAVQDDHQKLIRDFARQRMLVLDVAKNSYADWSLFGTVDFFEAELFNRAHLGAAMRAAQIKDAAVQFDRFDNECALRLDSGPPSEDQPRPAIQRDEAGGALVFTHEGRTVARFEPADIVLPAPLQHRFVNFLAYHCSIHPEVRRALADAHAIPQRLVFTARTFDRVTTTTLRLVSCAPAAAEEGDLPTHAAPEDASHDPILKALAAIRTAQQAAHRPTRAEAVAFADDAIARHRPLDAILALLEYGLQSGEPLSAEIARRREAFSTDPDCNLYRNAFDQSSKAACERSLATNARIPRDHLQHAYMLDLQRANLLEPLGKADEARQLFLRVLEANPFHAGALHDLGLLLAHSWQQPHAWLCWDIARRVYPQHPMLKEIAARERILQSRYPDFF